jgi:hypothetical protein
MDHRISVIRLAHVPHEAPSKGAITGSDLSGLRPQVPSFPDFSSNPCRISTASAAHLRGTRSTVSCRPWIGLITDSHKKQGLASHLASRFRVAQTQKTSINASKMRIRSKGIFQFLAPVVAVPAPLRAYGFTSLSSIGD